MSTVGGPEHPAPETGVGISAHAQAETTGRQPSSAGTPDNEGPALTSNRGGATLSPTNSDAAQSKSGSASRPTRKKKRVERPKSISELFQHAYGEATAGRKLVLARDLSDLNVDPDASNEENHLVRRLAAGDTFLVAAKSASGGGRHSDEATGPRPHP
jgi:hypothetical protein